MSASRIPADAPPGVDEGVRWARWRELPDLRMVLLGAAAWLGGLAAHGLPGPALLACAGGLLGLVLVVRRRWPDRLLTTVGAMLVAVAVGVVALVRLEAVAHSPVADLARERAVVSVVATVGSDPRPLAGRFGDELVMVRVTVREVAGRGSSHRLRSPVLVLTDDGWSDVPLGARVRATGRLAPPDDRDVAAVLSAAGPPQRLARPDVWWRAADAVRRSVRASVAHRPADQAALVPALVDGDDASLDPRLAEDFRVTGLTHLLAVSGTNLTLVVGFLLVASRWAGVRGRWRYLVGALGIAGFVLIARTEPSVVRAAAMGSVALLGMGVNGLRRGLRALGVAVTVLLLLQPGLAVSVGFALSVLATAGILVMGPVWRDALARWLPRWLAEAVAVPTAAQLACTPLVAAISGQVSLVAVIANLLAAPAVGPATVLGLAGAVAGLVWDPLGRPLGTVAGWCVGWIIAVAERGAGLPTAAVGWGTGADSLVVLTALTAALALLGPRLVARPVPGIACCLLVAVVVTVRLPTPGWPPDGWVVVACDVGQGDGLVVRSGPGEAIVVDAGPEPAAMDACLDRLHVDRVPLVVLTHFHADHVDGLAGVLQGREVGVVETSTVLDPAGGVRLVDDVAARAGVPAGPSPPGVRRIGEVTLRTLWPEPGPLRPGPGDGSAANDASVVVLAEVRGVTMLLTGDVEPPSQAALARSVAGLEVDVLKFPHHGSRHQDVGWLTSLRPRVVLVSVGADNDYGHPSSHGLLPLAAAGARVLRTDLHGDLAVLVRDGELVTRTSR